MSDERTLEAATWLFGETRAAEMTHTIPPRVVESVTADDLGPVPPEFLASPLWEVITTEDRDQLLRFRRFLAAVGPLRKSEPEQAR